MAYGTPFRTKSRRLAMILLLVFGSIIIIFGLLVLSVGLAITHNDSFRNTILLEEKVDTTVDYVQYWIGLPYVFTGVSVACSAVNLRRVALTVCTILLSLICVVLSLAGLVVDGPDFVLWKDYRASQRYWEGQDGFACSSVGGNCTCENKSKPALPKIIAGFTDCETLSKISALYGLLIGSFIVGLVLLLSSVFMIVYIVSRRVKAKKEGRTSYNTSKETKVRDSLVEMNPIYDAPGRTDTNRGYEKPVDEPETIRYREYSSKESDNSSKASGSVNERRKDADSSVIENDGMVMMDPGRFRLGDDDIY